MADHLEQEKERSITTIGWDLAKNVFQAPDVDGRVPRCG